VSGSEERGTWFEPGPKWLVAVALVLAIYAAGFSFVGGQDALKAVTDAALLPLVGALLLQAAVLLIWPLVHRASLRAVGDDLRYPDALKVSMTAFTVSHMVPGGGAVGAAAAVERLNRFGVPGPTATASVSLTGPLTLTTIGALGAIGITVAVITGELPGVALALAIAGVVILLAISGGIVAALHSPGIGEAVIDRLGRLHRKLRERADRWKESWTAVSEDAPTGRNLARILGWSALKWTADIGSLALVFLAFGQTPRLSTLLVGFGVSQTLTAIPSTPGAVGIYESGMVGAFSALGIPLGVATTVTLAYRLFETWLPALAGIPVVLRPRDEGA
jgi:uncharacterized protein (TIRG00374 family)